MARAIGLDVRSTQVRAVLLQRSYRKLSIEALREVSLAEAGGVPAAIAACVGALGAGAEPVAIAVEGERSFIHRLTLPVAAQKQLDEVLAFELEAQIPLEFSELVYDSQRLPTVLGGSGIRLLTAAARTDYVRGQIGQVAAALGREPERVGCGPLPLSNLASLCPALEGPAPCMIVDLGGARTEALVLLEGRPALARTLSRGVASLPEGAPQLAAELRQTLGAWAATGEPEITRVLLVGVGASMPGAEPYLARELGVEVASLPPLSVELASPELGELTARFAKSVALAAGLLQRPRDLNLRQGELGFQRGFGFLKEKLPVVAGLVVALFVSFAFSTWAELRGIAQERQLLEASLATSSKQVLGEETSDPERVAGLLEKAKAAEEADPLPMMDAFDVLVVLSKGIPLSVTHDIEEFDMQRAHVRMTGIVGTASDAQLVAGVLKANACIVDPKIGKLTQVVNSERQKYTMEFDVRCPEEAAAKKKKAEAPVAEGAP